MTAHADALRARAAQATTAREAAELALLAVLPPLGIDVPVHVSELIHWRAVEGAIEAAPKGELAVTYSRYRRAVNAEAKAKRAALMAQAVPMPAPAAQRAKRPRKTAARMTIAAYLELAA